MGAVNPRIFLSSAFAGLLKMVGRESVSLALISSVAFMLSKIAQDAPSISGSIGLLLKGPRRQGTLLPGMRQRTRIEGWLGT